MKKILIVIASIAVLLGLGFTVAQADTVRSLIRNPDGVDVSEVVLNSGEAPLGAQPPAIHQLILENEAGGCWYRDEFGRLFNVNEPHQNVVHNCMCRGEYPTWVYASDQEALGLTNAELEAKGYAKTAGGDWQLQASSK